MRIAVVGCGYWGAKHVRVLCGLPHVRQVVAVDPRPDVRDRIAATFPSVRAVPRLHDALPVVDAVVLAVPPQAHAPLGLEVLRAGRHLLVEKPLATDVADAERLVLEADAAGLTLMVGHTFEYNPAVWKLREVVASGDLGDIYYVDTARLNLGLYQSDVNVVWDLAPHDVSIANHVLRAEPDVVQAWGRSHAHTSLEDVAYIRLHYAALDVTAQIHVSWLDPHKVRRVTVVGSRRMAVYNDLASEERLRIYDKGVDRGLDRAGVASADGHPEQVPMSYRIGDIVSPYIDFAEPLALEDEHFVTCIRDGTRPWTDGRNGLAVVRAVEAAQLALHEQRPVHLDRVGA